MASTQPSKTFKITVAAVIIAGAIAWLETRPGEGAEAAKKITAQAENTPAALFNQRPTLASKDCYQK